MSESENKEQDSKATGSNQPAASSAPAAASKGFNTNLILVVGFVAVCATILQVGKRLETELDDTAQVRAVVLGDDFWMNLPEGVKALRDNLAVENRVLNAKLDALSPKLKAAQEKEEGDEATKLNDEIETEIGEQERKVKQLQAEYFRKINALRHNYMAKHRRVVIE